MNKFIILVLLAVVAIGAFLVWSNKQPFGPNVKTPEGKEAKAYDDYVQQAINFQDKYDYTYMGADWGAPGMGPSETKAVVLDLQAKGAPGLSVVNLKKHVMMGKPFYVADGAVVDLPTDPAKRAGVFTAAAPLFAAAGKTEPKDVNQKYLYIGSWTPDKQPGFMPD